MIETDPFARRRTALDLPAVEAPPRPLAARDRVDTADELQERALVGTVVQDADGDVGKRVALEGDVTWSWLDIGQSGDLNVTYPVTVLRVPEGGEQR